MFFRSTRLQPTKKKHKRNITKPVIITSSKRNKVRIIQCCLFIWKFMNLFF
ncbi:hypothetical protein HanXRQr2_Chr16g0777881 [Helianthus annuus]|uniref:Uncharacterized protein n=1 Tax=Helianthus annuus TaxID=4232 RepID=A0A9K3DVZ6_HELAN|nr:hypothetical protein HanXRQr2_Chr16g0777881 [Helianthus annuus]KAJ0823661.1 hypothetical protein HanPSC8_Chr16g0746261 [Helianthus annuus]